MKIAVSFFVFNTILFIILSACFLWLIELLKVREMVTGIANIIFIATQFCFLLFIMVQILLLSCGLLVIKGMNKILKSYLNTSQEVIQGSDIFRNASKVYMKLCDVYNQIIKIFIFANVFATGGFVYFIIFNTYTVFISLNNPNDTLYCYFALANALWGIMYAPCIMFVMAASSQILTECQKSAGIVHQLAAKADDDRTLKQCKNFVLLTDHYKPVVSCGLFEINWKTAFMMLGSIFNYSIILIQFYDIT